MIVSLWMSRNVITIGPDTSITEAAAVMARSRIRRLPVVHPNTKQLIGIVSNSDLYRAFPLEVNPFSVVAQEGQYHHRPVSEVMTPHPLTITPEAPIEEAARIMRDQKIAALPVVKDDELVGVITESDIFKAFLELLESNAGDVSITFDASHSHDLLEWMVKRTTLHQLHVESLISYRHDERLLCVVRVSGSKVDKLVEDLWRSGHPVLNILRTH